MGLSSLLLGDWTAVTGLLFFLLEFFLLLVGVSFFLEVRISFTKSLMNFLLSGFEVLIFFIRVLLICHLLLQLLNSLHITNNFLSSLIQFSILLLRFFNVNLMLFFVGVYFSLDHFTFVFDVLGKLRKAVFHRFNFVLSKLYS